MTDYDDGPRSLPWDLLHPLVNRSPVEDDPAFGPSSFVWPSDPNERTLVPFWLSLNEYNILGSTIDVGSDPAFGEDALRVVWLWLRNMRINVPICDAIIQCIQTNPATSTAIVNMLINNSVFNSYIDNKISTVAPGGGGNVYPPRPTTAEPDALCNAATYVVAQLRELIDGIFNDFETLTVDEIFASLLGVFGWRSSPLYQLIGLLETADYFDFMEEFDLAAPDLICELIASELDQTPILAWIASEYPPPSVLGDGLTQAVTAAADDGRWAQWIAVGAVITTADCSGCDEPIGNCYDLLTSAYTFVPLNNNSASYGSWVSGQGLRSGTAQMAFTFSIPDVAMTTFQITFNEPVSGTLNLRNANGTQSAPTSINTSPGNTYTVIKPAGVMTTALYIGFIPLTSPARLSNRITQICWS